MKIDLKRISELIDFEAIRNLYFTAFPPEERRESDGLTALLSNKECAINQMIVNDEKVAGFIILWKFSEFVFIEHFAVFPELRGLGTGALTLSLLRSKFPVILLESELPVDEISRRRIKFYQRNGFRVLPQKYFQPSYGENKPEVELILLSTADLSAEKLNKNIQEIREKVYGYTT